MSISEKSQRRRRDRAVRTVEIYLVQNADEFARNGYEVLKGTRSKTLKLAIQNMDVPETDFGNISRVSSYVGWVKNSPQKARFLKSKLPTPSNQYNPPTA